MRVEQVGRGTIRLSLAGVAIAVLAVTSGCGGRAPDPRAESGAELVVVSANLLGTPIATVAVEVTAADLPHALVFNLTVRNGIATGTIELQPGPARTITVRAFDDGGEITHEGTKTIDVTRGHNPPVSIPMVARAGHVPIVVQLGPVAIVVAPGSTSMTPGGTLQLTATIHAPTGEVIPGAVAWATSNPAVATVDANGLVTAVSAGRVTVVATYAGVAGTSAIGVGTPAWSGVRQLGSSADDAVAGIALHAGSALYVVGYTAGELDGNRNLGGKDAFLVKLDLSGARLWTRQLGSAADDQATAVAVDAAGGVYVAGDLGAGTSGSVDAFLAKYDSSGNALWTRPIATPEEDRARGVLLDAAGNVHVVGATRGGLDGNVHLGEADVFLAAFDPAGGAIRTRQLGTPQTEWVARATIDGAGTIHVAGTTGGNFSGAPTSFPGPYVLRIDAAGSPHVFQPNLLHNSLTSVAVDRDGNQFLAGFVVQGGTSSDGYCWKKDPLDAEVWSRRFGVSGSAAFDFTWDAAVDSAGSAFVTGSTDEGLDHAGGLDGNVSAGGQDLFLVKFDPAGNKLWTRQLGTAGQDEGRSLVVDGAGDAYVAGNTTGAIGGNGSAGGADFFVVKYDRLGVKQ